MQKYNPGNPFSKRLSIADAAVAWAGLREEQLQHVSVTDDGWPKLESDRSLRQRAEAIHEALRDGELEGLSKNEDGYPVQPLRCWIERASFEDWLRKRKGAETTASAVTSAGEAILDVAAVAKMMGFSEKTLRRRRLDGLFPEPDFENPLRWKRSTVVLAQYEEAARTAVKD